MTYNKASSRVLKVAVAAFVVAGCIAPVQYSMAQTYYYSTSSNQILPVPTSNTSNTPAPTTNSNSNTSTVNTTNTTSSPAVTYYYSTSTNQILPMIIPPAGTPVYTYNYVYPIQPVQYQTINQSYVAPTSSFDLSYRGPLSSQLSIGSRSSDVASLQAFLSGQSGIYPQALITGYFGQLTSAAVTRFQTANGLPGVGRVGPMTLAKINSMITGGVTTTNGVDITAPTIYNISITPYSTSGQTYYPLSPTTTTYPNGSVSCTGYPSANATCSTTSNGTLITTTYPSGTAITSGNTVINWSTTELTSGKVFYSSSPLQETEGPIPFISGNVATDTNLNMAHSVALSGLSAGTTYYYVIEATDPSGNISVTNQATFVAQ